MPRIGDIRLLATRNAAAMAALVMALAIASFAGAQQPVDANRPIVLTPPIAPDTKTEQPAPGPAVAAAKPPESEKPAAPAPRSLESRPIGKPNGPLSARPPTATPEPDANAGERKTEASGSWLGVFDPRRNDFTRVLGALAAVVGLILLTRTLAVRYLPSLSRGRSDRPSGVLEVLARYPIGRGQQLVVLKFARRIVLIHQAGATARTLTEMTDPDEVAATLSRLEAGATARSAGRFKAALQSFETEHEAAQAQRSRAGAALAATETEIIDLTRTQIRSIGSFAGVRRSLR